MAVRSNQLWEAISMPRRLMRSEALGGVDSRIERSRCRGVRGECVDRLLAERMWAVEPPPQTGVLRWPIEPSSRAAYSRT